MKCAAYISRSLLYFLHLPLKDRAPETCSRAGPFCPTTSFIFNEFQNMSRFAVGAFLERLIKKCGLCPEVASRSHVLLTAAAPSPSRALQGPGQAVQLGWAMCSVPSRPSRDRK